MPDFTLFNHLAERGGIFNAKQTVLWHNIKIKIEIFRVCHIFLTHCGGSPDCQSVAIIEKVGD